ncbi:MAG TPA: ATP-grasp domain-containing protein [Thermomicrobiales bacterium]|nr:ATP-grasp domain-containing protein [Thermomicrobiales bacterium]
MSPATYRAGAFLDAARTLGLEVIQALDLPEALQAEWNVPLGVAFSDPDAAAARIVAGARHRPIDAVVAVDDSATLVQAKASAALGLPHNDPESALAARDKFVMRERFAAAGVPVPEYRRVPASLDPASIAGELAYPCVVKPLRLSGSRGVIRADDPSGFCRAFERTRRIVVGNGEAPEHAFLLVERYLPGVEVALEGLLSGGELRVLALFDKPDPLEGPFFEETIYITPSRLPTVTQAAVAERTAEAAGAVGLREGPIHAELRINDEGVWPIELAGRSIGGLCSTVLEFGAGVSLETLILRHAVGLPLPDLDERQEAAGVMMIPIPKGGMLRGVEGLEAARAVKHVTGIEITAKLNQPLVPLPEGASYLGFIFARAGAPDEAEAALREAHAKLGFRIDPLIALTMQG